MSAFYVGQRVKLKRVRNPFWAFLVGTEGTVCAIGPFPAECGWTEAGDVRVRMDCHGHVGQFLSSQIEPLIPPGLESLEDINALYETNPCEADV